LVLFPSSVNPFIFGWRLPHFKQALRVIISRRSANCEQDRSAGQIESSTFAEDGSNRFYRAENGFNHLAAVIGTLTSAQLGLKNINLERKKNATDGSCLSLGVTNKMFTSPENEDSDLELRQEQSLEHQTASPPSDTNIRKDYRLTSIV
jgi:hypothetical protein